MFETELVLSAISGAKLMDLEFMPQEFVVRGLLPNGLSILGGAPKIGKSWLMLELALRVANGEPMWDMETKQGTVVLLLGRYLTAHPTASVLHHRKCAGQFVV